MLSRDIELTVKRDTETGETWKATIPLKNLTEEQIEMIEEMNEKEKKELPARIIASKRLQKKWEK